MNAEESWVPIANQDDAADFLDLSRDLHDSITTLANWMGAEEIDSAGRLAMRGYGSLTLRISSQFADVPNLELRFDGVRSYHYDYEDDIEPSFEFNARGVLAKFVNWEIRAESLAYRSSPKTE